MYLNIKFRWFCDVLLSILSFFFFALSLISILVILLLQIQFIYFKAILILY